LADNRCPLCMEKLKNGECLSCGYKLPDEENISSVYDYEPAEYPEPEPVIREITPEVQMEEIYPNRDSALKFKVRDDEGKTVKVDLDKPRDNTANETKTTNSNPYAGYTPEGVPNQSVGSPFANPSANQTVDTDSTSAFMKKFWWLLLLSFMFPIIGIILNSTMKNELKQYKASYFVIIAIVLGFVLPP